MKISIPFFLKTFLLMLLIGQTCSANAQWTVERPAAPVLTFNDTYFVDATTGWGVGTGGGIYKIIDGGVTWMAQASNTTAALNGVQFIDANTGYAVGNGGIIRKTINGGATWTTVTSGTSADLMNIYFTNASIGWIVGTGGLILKTTNSGATWIAQTSNTTYTLNDVYFTDVNNGVAVGALVVRETSNGGTTWNSVTVSRRLQAVYFPTAAIGYAVGELGRIQKTTDGGTVWNVQSIGGTTQNFTDVYFTDVNTGWAVGDAGVILKTTNGTNWSTQTSGTTANLNSVYFENATTGWISGSSGTLLKTTNGGTTWVVMASNSPLNAASFVTPDLGWAVGNAGQIRKTTDAGQTWALQKSGILTDLESIYFTDANTGWAVGAGGVILKTTNGGNTWTAQASLISNLLNDVYFTDANNGVAIGFNIVLKTTNGGATWTGAALSRVIQAVYFPSSTIGYAVGALGRIQKTTDGGTGWNVQSIGGTTQNFTDVYFADALTGWAVGEAGVILKTTNGTNWSTQTSGSTANLNSVYFQDALTGWIGGDNGTLLKTINGGTTWVVEPTGTTQDINDIGQGWAIGEGGIVLMNQALLTLPLQLLSISLNSGSECKSGLLQWTTADEQRVSHFDIETSADGLNFKPVGQVNAANRTIAHYSYRLNYSQLPLHVRLKMTDLDGRFTYSKIITVKDACGGATAFSWSISPNPMRANGSLQLSLTQYKGAGPLLVELFDMQGRPQTKVTLNPVTGSGTYTTAIAMPKALSSGVYTIRISNDSFSESRRIVLAK